MFPLYLSTMKPYFCYIIRGQYFNIIRVALLLDSGINILTLVQLNQITEHKKRLIPLSKRVPDGHIYK